MKPQPDLDTDMTGGFGRRRLLDGRLDGRRGAQMGLLRIGLQAHWSDDLYHRALRLTWPRFFLAIGCIYIAANLLFGVLFWLQPNAIANARPGSFSDAFFFSVETFGTIGYGVLSPGTDYANVLMTIEALVSMVLAALMTGVMFARVSRPTARVLFSNVMVITPYEGALMLMVRMGNERPSQILQAEVGMSLVRNERSREGQTMRRFYDLKLERKLTPVFAMSFTAMHRIDVTSPLHDMTRDMLERIEAEILVTVTGLDETMAQTVHARKSYLPEEMRFGHRYTDVFGVTPDGRRAIDYRRFHGTEEVLEG